MLTPSDEVPSLPSDVPPGQWAPRPETPRRSVFGNYRPAEAHAGDQTSQEAQTDQLGGLATAPHPPTLQAAIDLSLARSFLYNFLARAFAYPDAENWSALTAPVCRQAFHAALATLAEETPALATAGQQLAEQFQADAYETFASAYVAAAGHAARGVCPMNEIEYGDLKADPLFQPHRLADLAAFYRAFGLELSAEADERQDHICLELEFLCVLTAKEAYALEHQLDAEELALCRAAQKQFLREHLGRWTPAFTRRLTRQATGTPLAALAHFTRAFVEAECARLGVPAGSEDLLLRPVNEADESLCGTCGLATSDSLPRRSP